MKELKELLHKCWIQAQKKLHDPLTEKGFKSFCDEHLKEPVKQDKDIRIIQCKLCKSNITCSFHGPNINNNCKYYIKKS